MIGKGEILVIDDFISLEYQEIIKKELMGFENNFPWIYTEDVTGVGDYDSQYRPALAHQYVSIDDDDISEIICDYHHLFVPMLSRTCQYLKMPEMNVIQGRSFLQFPLNLRSKDVDTPHIDLDEGQEHTVVLYYVVSADGDTIIYNERTESLTYTEKQRVTPKQGRVVIFDGGQYHTAEQPSNGTRCIVNYNLGLW
tara:strand:- start:2311 stop:2898 length:588 start_codon:yes stop_codon:yes gene_type:complete